MNRLAALLRPPPKAATFARLDTGKPVRRGPRARVIQAAKTVSVFAGPRWIAFHAVVWVLAVTMVLLGRWQLDVSNSKHFDLQNFGYALQWWSFAAFGLFLWARVMRHRLRPPTPPSNDGGLVLATAGRRAPIGPAELVAPSGEAGQAPIVYRGYVMPQSSDRPVGSHGDTYHDVYNDYLWQLALADGAMPPGPKLAGPAEERPSAGPDDRAGRAIEPPPPVDPGT